MVAAHDRARSATPSRTLTSSRSRRGAISRPKAAPPTRSCSTRRWSSSPGQRCSPTSPPAPASTPAVRIVVARGHLPRRRSGRRSPSRPAPGERPVDPTGSARRLVEVSRPATWSVRIPRRLAGARPRTPRRCVRLIGDAVVPSLAAAAHGPIYLHHLGRCRTAVAHGRRRCSGTWPGSWPATRRGPLRGWTTHRAPEAPRSTSSPLLAARPRRLGPPESTFIHPLMDAVESSGLAAEVVGHCGRAPDVDMHAATIALMRIATGVHAARRPRRTPRTGGATASPSRRRSRRSRPILDDPTGSSAVAATHVVGFRAGSRVGTPRRTPWRAGAVGDDGLLAGLPDRAHPIMSATIDYAASPSGRPPRQVRARLPRRGPHRPERRHAASARRPRYLADWWRVRPAPDDPILAGTRRPTDRRPRCRPTPYHHRQWGNYCGSRWSAWSPARCMRSPPAAWSSPTPRRGSSTSGTARSG